jgi:hypothetical protein
MMHSSAEIEMSGKLEKGIEGEIERARIRGKGRERNNGRRGEESWKKGLREQEEGEERRYSNEGKGRIKL